MPRRSPATLALLAGCLVLAAGAVIKVIPWLTDSRDLVSSVPGLPPLATVTPVTLDHGRRACATNVTIDTDAGRVVVTGSARHHPAPPLRVTASAPGYRSVGTAPGGQPGIVSYSAPIQPPRHAVVGSVCVENDHATKIALTGTDEGRTNVTQTLVVDGRPVQRDLTMTILRARPTSYLSSFGTLLDRAATFKLGFLQGWMLWPVALIVFFGVPAVPLWALYRAFRADENIAP